MMSGNSTRRTQNMTTAEVSRIDALRAKYQKIKPTVDQLLADGNIAVDNEDYWSLMKAMATLKRRRIALGLSLRQISQRTGIDHAALSRLENGITDNPTYHTVTRYARAVDSRLVLSVENVVNTLGVTTSKASLKFGSIKSTALQLCFGFATFIPNAVPQMQLTQEVIVQSSVRELTAVW